MDVNQSLIGANASQFSNTGNPQNIGTPSLSPAASASNLQNLSISGGNLNTSGVNGITLSSTQTLFKPDTATTPPKSRTPYLIGGLVLVVVLAALVVGSLLWARQTSD